MISRRSGDTAGHATARAGVLVILCTLAWSSTAGSQHRHDPPRVTSRADTLASAPTTPSRPVTDSARVADSLLRVCQPHVKHSIDAYSGCIGTGLSALSGAGNIALALGTLDRLVNTDRSLVLLAHPLAHALGYAVQSTPKTASRLLEQCDERYQSGCYHGILQRYFATRMGMPITAAMLTAPCAPFRGTSKQFRLFDCLHGTGHGLMMYHRYDAAAALPDCDRLATEWDRSSCYGGVFMEHNMGARMQAFGEGEVGMHRHSTPNPKLTLYKPNDLHYPCNVTPERYRRDCYALQADIILPALKQNYLKASKVCDAAGAPELVRACYSGLGRNASGAAAHGFDGIKRRCASSSPWGAPFCYEGAVRQLAYAPSELPRGISFCRTLPDGPVRARCWGGLGLQIGGFFSDIAARRRACESDRPADVTPCIHGAGAAPSPVAEDDL
jgi:hypothetical protein